MQFKIALLGNPNSGKTSVYNILTGEFLTVGNRIGVTVSHAQGDYIKDKSVKIIDLPGIYSLSGKNEEEKVVLSYLKNNKIDRVINVIDGTNLERSLYLTAELAKLNIPIIVAINMADVLKKQGVRLDLTKIENKFNVKVVLISAKKKTGVSSLINIAKNFYTTPNPLKINSEKDYNAKKIEEIQKLVNNVIIKRLNAPSELTKLDKILTHNYLGFIIFALILLITYYLSSKIGGYFSQIISNSFNSLSNVVKEKMFLLGATLWFIDLISMALIKGIGSVISFLPQVLVLFFCLSLLEESGYTTRVAFLTDKLFSFFGLGGKSLISLSLSMGCTVNGITSTKTIDGESERRLAIILCPFIPCGAKSAVFGWLSHVFFNGNPLVSVSLYFVGIFSVAIFGAILKRFKPFGLSNDTFLLEIPSLKIPNIKNVIKVLFEKSKDFLLKAGSVIFAVSVIVWFLRNFGILGYVGENSKQSFLYVIGDAIKYIFYPLGFGTVEASVSILTGVLAKEAVIETLEILSVNHSVIFNNQYSVYAFMVFILLSPPCISALSVAKRELKDKRWFLFMLAFEFVVAYALAFLINVIGVLTVNAKSLLIFIITVIIIALGILSILKLIKGKSCINCAFCKKGIKCKKR
jgi:ferrous iron transport protein B